ncbi:hypothetical protein AX16_005941 [Volvariella volvacea WC 439]|nr:hypothetical protein AX16_005941 [Volvariella volvacea WC 439]
MSLNTVFSNASTQSHPSYIGLPRVPLLPPSILHRIIQETWLLHLSTPQRIHLMRCLPLVNFDFYISFRQCSLTDVFIPNPNYLSKFSSILLDDYWRKATRSESAYNLAFSPINTCRSITFLYDLGNFLRTTDIPWCKFDDYCFAGRLKRGHELMIEHARQFSAIINESALLPNLSSIGFQFIDIDVYRVLEFASAVKFPEQIKSLSIQMFELDSDFFHAARQFRCGTCKWSDAARSWKEWKFDLRQLTELRIDGAVGDAITIGEYVIPDKDKGGSLRKLDLNPNGWKNTNQKVMIEQLRARVKRWVTFQILFIRALLKVVTHRSITTDSPPITSTSTSPHYWYYLCMPPSTPFTCS